MQVSLQETLRNRFNGSLKPIQATKSYTKMNQASRIVQLIDYVTYVAILNPHFLPGLFKIGHVL